MTSQKSDPALIRNFIDGEFLSNGGDRIMIESPLTGLIYSQVEISTLADVNLAVEAAKKAFNLWSQLSIKERVKILYRYKHLLEANLNDLAHIIHIENGKTAAEAVNEVERCIELTEFACSLPQLVTGEIVKENNQIEYRIERKAIGVVTSIVAFNFPMALPHYTMPNAIALGNCMILKPSKQGSMIASKIAMLLKEAGLPNGVFNIINGGKESVNDLCDNPDIKAVSFIGSTNSAQSVYIRSTSKLKRCIALGSAKNHTILLPDADADATAYTIARSFSECAGQRCMAPSVLVAVGNTDNIIAKICQAANDYRPNVNIGPVISKEQKNKIIAHIDKAQKSGASIIVDGRLGIEELEGYYVGPTIIDKVTPDMEIAREEVFGPVLTIVRVNNLDDAIKIINSSKYGNAASVFTQNNSIAQKVLNTINAGMIGVNMCLPSDRYLFSFGGFSQSKFGGCDINGKSSIEFWTNLKKSYSIWKY